MAKARALGSDAVVLIARENSGYGMAPRCNFLLMTLL